MFSFKTKTHKNNLMRLLVQSIHNDFYNMESIIKSEGEIVVKTKNSSDYKEKYLVLETKLNTLKSLHLTASKTFNDLDEELNSLKKMDIAYKAIVKTLEALNYFKQTYPAYKFIIQNSVNVLCQKYELLCKPISEFIGTIPEKNLNNLLEASIKDQDLVYRSGYPVYSERRQYNSETKEYDEIHILQSIRHLDSPGEGTKPYPRNCRNRTPRYIKDEDVLQYNGYVPEELFICAPEKDFKKEVKSTFDDPIILQPVMFNDTKYYLIITAWGPEAEDPKVKIKQ